MPNPPLVEFIRANGLNEHDVAAAFPLILEGGQLTVTEFVFETLPDSGRRRVIIEADGGDVVKKRTVTVPLVSPPEDHGL